MRSLNYLSGLGLAIVLSIGLSGCGSAKLYSVSPNYNESIRSNNDTLLVIDSCVREDNVGDSDDNFILYKSKIANNAEEPAIKKFLELRGFKITQVLRPTMCGFLKDGKIVAKVQMKKDGKLTLFNPPYIIDNSLDENLTKALQRVSQVSFLSSLHTTDFNNVFRNYYYVKDDMKLIAEKTGSKKIFVINSLDFDVSAANSVGKGIGTAVLTLGMFSTWSTGALKTYATLIDIEKNEILWRTALVIKYPNLYDEDWYLKYFNKNFKDLGKTVKD